MMNSEMAEMLQEYSLYNQDSIEIEETADERFREIELKKSSIDLVNRAKERVLELINAPTQNNQPVAVLEKNGGLYRITGTNAEFISRLKKKPHLMVGINTPCVVSWRVDYCWECRCHVGLQVIGCAEGDHQYGTSSCTLLDEECDFEQFLTFVEWMEAL
ncbi:MAG: hypothetical protein RIQ54_667 [Candidatus Parcubacteria bacterium]|jgi:hypothetical protein